MNALYIVLIQLISAVDGSVITQYHVGEPVTLQECNAKLLRMGPIKARDGIAVVTWCQKVGGIET